MLVANKTDDLSRMFKMCQRVDKGNLSSFFLDKNEFSQDLSHYEMVLAIMSGTRA